MAHELLAPTIIGTADIGLVNQVVEAATEQDPMYWDAEPSDEARFAFDAFRHLEANLHAYYGLSTEESVRLHRVKLDTDTAPPNKPYILRASDWHIDHVSRSKYTEVLLHTTDPTQYASGTLEDDEVEAILGFGRRDEELTWQDVENIGVDLERYTDEEIPYSGIRILQPIAYAAHLLTNKHLHRSSINQLDHRVSRTQINLTFKYQAD